MSGIILINWNVIQKIILNTFFISIPEEIFIIMFTLILIGEFDYWKEDECKYLIDRWDYSRILIPSISCALLSNILRYNGLYHGINSLIPILLLFILIVLTNDIFKDANALNWIGKALISYIITLVFLAISEFLYLSFILDSTNTSLKFINQLSHMVNVR